MMKQQKTLLVLAIISAFVGTGIFLPGPVGAGDLEPPGPPGSTMKTLDQISPTWSQKIPGADRFELVLDGEAVLDKETGLVWEQDPWTATSVWADACNECYIKYVGGRGGWRLPTVEELASLVDVTQNSPALPVGHPFSSDVQSSGYWSSTTYVPVPAYAHYVSFYGGLVSNTDKNLNVHHVWCVRGGHGHNYY